MPHVSQSHALKPASETSRSLALRVLLKVELSNMFANEAFDQLTCNSPLSREDGPWHLNLCVGCFAIAEIWIGD